MSAELAWTRFTNHSSYRRYRSLIKYELPGARAVFMLIYSEIQSVVSQLIPNASYTTEILCGPEIWRRFPADGQHRALGIALSAMVEMGFVPLRCVTADHIKNKRYAVIPELQMQD